MDERDKKIAELEQEVAGLREQIRALESVVLG
jgi:hypothetical protein